MNPSSLTSFISEKSLYEPIASDHQSTYSNCMSLLDATSQLRVTCTASFLQLSYLTV